MSARLPIAFRRLALPATAALLLSTAACTPPQDANTAVERAVETADAGAGLPAEPGPEGTSGCDAEAAQSAIGQVATEDVVAQAQALAGAELVRVLRPGEAATMDFREERLNLEVDDNNVIVSTRCG